MSKALRKLNTIWVKADQKKQEHENSRKNDTLSIEDVIKRYEEQCISAT